MADITGSLYYYFGSELFTSGNLLPDTSAIYFTNAQFSSTLGLTSSLSAIYHDYLDFFIITSNEERPILYKFRGWNTSSLSFEYWTGTSMSHPPPSGNPLVEITIVGSLG